MITEVIRHHEDIKAEYDEGRIETEQGSSALPRSSARSSTSIVCSQALILSLEGRVLHISSILG